MHDEREYTEQNTREDASAYSDAYYRQAPESRRSCYGYSPAQCYARASESEALPTSARRKKHPGTGVLIAVLCIVCILMIGLLGSGELFLTYHANAVSPEATPNHELYEELSIASEPDPALPLSQSSAEETQELSAEEIYTRACLSTVGVTIPGYAYNIFGQPGASVVTGTGIVLSEDGYVLTNFHVIETAYEKGVSIRVLMYDGEEYEAEVIGVETDSDLAVLKIEAEDLTPATLGNSDGLRVGQTIYTVGNPLGELTYTMTSGIVSALDRMVTTDVNVTVNMFQIDAAVNNGNSGGPVFNVSGQVIGVVTAKYSLFGMEGLGFAIPINDACRIANDLVDKGYVTGKAYLGLTFANVSAGAARYYKMVQGVYIYSVEEGSCSETAGLKNGDIITAIDGTPIADSGALVQAVKGYHAGDSAVFTVWRDQGYLEIKVTFDEELPTETSDSGELFSASGDLIERQD